MRHVIFIILTLCFLASPCYSQGGSWYDRNWAHELRQYSFTFLYPSPNRPPTVRGILYFTFPSSGESRFPLSLNYVVAGTIEQFPMADGHEYVANMTTFWSEDYNERFIARLCLR